MDVTGKPFPSLIQEIVFSRLRMRHSTFEQSRFPDDFASLAATGHKATGEKYGCRFVYPEMAAAGLWTTPSDLARFVIEIQKSRSSRSNRVLSSKLVSQMLTPQIENDGLGLFIAGKGKGTRFSHGGGNQGFFSYIVGYPETGQGAAVMINGTDYWDLVHEIVRGIAAEYRWPDYIQKRRLAKLDPKVYEELVGRYEIAPDFVLTVAIKDGRLILKDSGAELLPESPTKFFLLDGRRVIFFKDERRRTNRLMIQQNDFKIRAKRLVTFP
jgi:hypothetical protein